MLTEEQTKLMAEVMNEIFAGLAAFNQERLYDAEISLANAVGLISELRTKRKSHMEAEYVVNIIREITDKMRRNQCS